MESRSSPRDGAFPAGDEPRGGRGATTLLIELVAVGVFAAAVALVLGMHRGLILASDVKSWCWPWGGVTERVQLQAPTLSDTVWQFVPFIQLARSQIAAGELPLWNPHQDAGVPLLGNYVSALASPLLAPALVLGPEDGWNLSLLLRLVVAAVGAYLFTRSLGRSRPGGALAALAFALSGPMIAWLELPHDLVMPWVPWLLLAVDRTALRGRMADVAALACVTWAVLAGGHPEIALIAALLAAARLAFVARTWRAAAPALAGALAGAGLAAPLLLPFLEYYGLSAAAAGAGRQAFVLPREALLRFIAPHADVGHPIEAAATVSVTVLLMAVVGAALTARGRETRFWMATAAAILLVVYDNPAARLLAAHTPGYWTRSLLFLALPLGYLAAVGLDELCGRVARRAAPLAAAAAAAAVLGAGAELLAAARGVHAVTDPAEITRTTPLLAALAADRDVFRVLPLHTFLPPCTASVYGLDDVRNYDALHSRAWRATREAMGRFSSASPIYDVLEPWDVSPGGAALDAWNVKYLLLHPQLAAEQRTLESRGLDLERVYSGPDGIILRNRRVLPRARLTGAGEVAVSARSATRWRLRTAAAAPAELVLANPYYPGWRAAVDGVRVRIDAAVGAEVRIAVPAGVHEVEVVYRPKSFALGVGLAVTSAGALTLAGVRRRRRAAPIRR
jgi:hypothetical protein